MFLKQMDSTHLVEIMDLGALTDPFKTRVQGRLNVGEELPEAEYFEKSRLRFPSGEKLPECWTDSHYRDGELRH